VGILNEMEFNMGLFAFHKQMKFNLRKRGFIRQIREMNFMMGILTLDFDNSLSRGSGPTKSQRNALSLYDLKDF